MPSLVVPLTQAVQFTGGNVADVAAVIGNGEELADGTMSYVNLNQAYTQVIQPGEWVVMTPDRIPTDPLGPYSPADFAKLFAIVGETE